MLGRFIALEYFSTDFRIGRRSGRRSRGGGASRQAPPRKELPRRAARDRVLVEAARGDEEGASAGGREAKGKVTGARTERVLEMKH